jgi:hypothetical protein
MKQVIFIFLFFASLESAGQKMKNFNTRFPDTTNKNFFLRNASIDQVRFSYNAPNSKIIAIYFKKEKNADANSYGDEFYNFNFIGDQYIFEKKYGRFLLPEKKIQGVLQKKCGPIFYLTLNAKPDTVSINLRSYCAPKKDEDRVFVKVEVWAAYKYGAKKLEERVQTALNKNNFTGTVDPADSVAIFRVMVSAKDSCLQNIELRYGTMSSFTNIVSDALKNACGWTPALQEGRKVNAYIKIYARLNKDRSITLAYPEINN